MGVQWLSSGSERTERRKRQTEGNRAIRSRMRMGMDGNERSVQGDSASPVRGACSGGMAWYSTTTNTRPPALPDTHTHTRRYTARRESSRPCFARDAANGASTDTQELQAPPILPWAHCGTEADGKVGDG